MYLTYLIGFQTVTVIQWGQSNTFDDFVLHVHIQIIKHAHILV